MRHVSALLLVLLTPFTVSAATPEDDVQEYISIFQGSPDSDRAADDLAWKGISDTRLFDVIEQKLSADAHATSRQDRNHAARLIKALGFSGQPKYAATLNGLSAEYQRPVERALINLKLYERWNPIIGSRASWDPQLPDDVNRVRNMLMSDDIQLQAVGAKRVFFGKLSDPGLLDLLAGRLRGAYQTVTDSDGVEAAGWMVNAIGKYGSATHRAVLDEVAAGAASDKLRSRARKALSR